MSKIVVTCTTGGLAGRRFEFDRDRVTIGRRDTNDVVLAPSDTTASSDHCELRYQAGTWVLADRASTNGTLVDGAEITGSVTVTTGLLFELGEGGPIMMAQLPDDESAGQKKAPAEESPPPKPRFNQVETIAPSEAAEQQLAQARQKATHRGPAPAPFSAVPVGGAPSPGEGPSTGRTAFYMALMSDKVSKSSRKLKVMIGTTAFVVDDQIVVRRLLRAPPTLTAHAKGHVMVIRNGTDASNFEEVRFVDGRAESR